jgi:hypothetical protein
VDGHKRTAKFRNNSGWDNNHFNHSDPLIS